VGADAVGEKAEGSIEGREAERKAAMARTATPAKAKAVGNSEAPRPKVVLGG